MREKTHPIVIAIGVFFIAAAVVTLVAPIGSALQAFAAGFSASAAVFLGVQFVRGKDVF